MNYETGDVPYQERDAQNKCERCGKLWVGARRLLCHECMDAKREETERDLRKALD